VTRIFLGSYLLGRLASSCKMATSCVLSLPQLFWSTGQDH
jgi:hypothetical protein